MQEVRREAGYAQKEGGRRNLWWCNYAKSGGDVQRVRLSGGEVCVAPTHSFISRGDRCCRAGAGELAASSEQSRRNCLLCLIIQRALCVSGIKCRTWKCHGVFDTLFSRRFLHALLNKYRFFFSSSRTNLYWIMQMATAAQRQPPSGLVFREGLVKKQNKKMQTSFIVVHKNGD